jgi:hypothetical protein
MNFSEKSVCPCNGSTAERSFDVCNQNMEVGEFENTANVLNQHLSNEK